MAACFRLSIAVLALAGVVAVGVSTATPVSGISSVVSHLSSSGSASPASNADPSWTALVVNDSSGSNSVSPVDTGTNTAGTAVSVGALPLGVAITPDARTAYVVNVGSSLNAGSLTPVDLTTTPPTAGTPISLSGHVPNFIAISPNGGLAYVSDPENGDVVPVNLTTNPPTVETSISVGGDPEGIAFTPDGSTALVAVRTTTRLSLSPSPADRWAPPSTSPQATARS